MLEILVFVLSVAVLIGSFGIFNLIRKNEAIEAYCDELEEFIVSIRTEVETTLEEMRKVDAKGAFASDDEVGDSFITLKGLIEKLNNFLKTEE